MFRHGGFSLIELLIALAIMGILLALGLPSFQVYMENTRIRTAAEGFLAAAELAKASAASTNSRVEIILTNNTDAGSLATAVGSASVAGATTGWMVRTADLAIYIEGKTAQEGGRGTQGAVNVARAVGGVTFTPLGSTTLAATATFSFTNPTGGLCIAAAGPMRCLNVVISTTGRIKLCDPDPAIVAPDSRACPA